MDRMPARSPSSTTPRFTPGWTGGTWQRVGPGLARRLHSTPVGWVSLASVVGTVGVWEWYGRGVDPVFFSYPTAIARVFPRMLASGELPGAMLSSLQGLALGWALATVAGFVLGLAMGRYRIVDGLLNAQVTALYSTPDVALIPLLILWFGLGLKSRAAIVLLAAIFPIILNTRAGVREVSRSFVDIAVAERAREWQVLLKIVVPASLPFMFAGLKVSVGRAVVGMVVAEMLMVITGLGGKIILYAGQSATDKLLAVVVVLALLGVLFTQGVELLERVTLTWKVRERTKG